jgi:DNA-binding response OmpR family regulator
MSRRILIVDDDVLMRRSLVLNLEQAGYQTLAAATAEDALALSQITPPDLVLLDIGLPGLDGLDALRLFKQQLAGVPVIFLTARRRNLDQVVGLELGADDYITKPFDVDVLLVRIKLAFRHTEQPLLAQFGSTLPPPAALTVGDLVLDPGARRVTLAGREIELTRREFDLLHALALKAGQVVSIDDLLAQVWGAEFAGEAQAIYVHIRWLREKLETDPERPRRIVSLRGAGYKLLPLEHNDDVPQLA